MSAPDRRHKGPLAQAIGNAFARERKRQGMNQRDFAMVLGLHQGSLSHLELGLRAFTVTDYVDLCRKAGLNPSILLAEAMQAIE